MLLASPRLPGKINGNVKLLGEVRLDGGNHRKWHSEQR